MIITHPYHYPLAAYKPYVRALNEVRAVALSQDGTSHIKLTPQEYEQLDDLYRQVRECEFVAITNGTEDYSFESFNYFVSSPLYDHAKTTQSKCWEYGLAELSLKGFLSNYVLVWVNNSDEWLLKTRSL